MFYYLNEAICKRCDHVVKEKDPTLFQIMKSRHEQGRHQHHYVIGRYGTKESKSAMGGLDIGTVEWIEIKRCKHNIERGNECTQCLIRSDLLLD